MKPGQEPISLESFLSKAPKKALTFRLEVRPVSGVQVLLDLDLSDLDGDLFQIVDATCTSHARASSMDTVFYGIWLTETGKVLSSFSWKAAIPEDRGPRWDGGIESLVGNLLAQIQAQNRLFLDQQKLILESSLQVQGQLLERNAYLERQRLETDRLREQLLKSEVEAVSGAMDAEKFSETMKLAQTVLTAYLPGSKKEKTDQ